VVKVIYKSILDQQQEYDIRYFTAKEGIKKFRDMTIKEGWDIGYLSEVKLGKYLESKVQILSPVGQLRFTKEELIAILGGRPPRRAIPEEQKVLGRLLR